ncbi:hypothetical protein ALC53_04982 [Atta colombica]|uniref:Uncharacterized protein n=1 Tax=Atta colombica TaxID=520822 RepID=A0A195BKM3_9HYME|nr:hypothetical protein ALC53_04982 [Atta colombica]
MIVAGQSILEEIAKEEVSMNCTSDKKKNQRYSSSFIANTTGRSLILEKEFDNVIGNNSKVKKSSSIHKGEDIILCWIETTTIKEDKSIRPPKRLVIREYTISFENSATISERYLECRRFEGELTADDTDIGKTALFDIIDEDTMVSRIVNFTSVSHVSNIITWEHKKLKCGVGPVVSKNIVELNDDSKIPKKRVEIKVSPKMHQLTATTTEEEYTESTLTESMIEYTILSCENACESTIISPNIVSKINKFTTEEIVTKLQNESENKSVEDHLSTAMKLLPAKVVSRKTTTFPKKMITIQEKIDCEENPSDPALLTTTKTAAIAETSSISDEEIISKEKIFHPSIEERSEEITESLSKEEKEIISEVTEKSIPFAFVKDIFTKSSKAYASRSTASVDTSSLKTNINESSSAERMKEYSKPKEDRGKSSITLTSEELEKVDYMSSSSESIMASSEVDIEPNITSAKSLEFTKEPTKLDRIFDKLPDKPISTKSVTKTVIMESSLMSKEVTSEETKEKAAIRGLLPTTISGLKTSEERKFISIITTMSPTKVRSTTLSPVISGEVSYSCENSEDCVSLEDCDEFGNCEKLPPQFDTIRSPKQTKVPLFESKIIDHSIITNVTTTMLIPPEGDKLMVKHITMDTRRSMTTSMPQHKLSLKVKILLEHINENKEKHNLVEMEKHLSLDENPEHHLNPDLLEQLKSLNDSVNMEIISTLLNCISLGNLTRNSNFVNKKPDNVDNDNAELKFTNTDFENFNPEQFTSGSDDTKFDYSEYQEHVTSRRRRRRSDNEMEGLNKFAQQNLYDSTNSAIDAFIILQIQYTELTTYNLQLSTMTNYSKEETTTNNYTEKINTTNDTNMINERNESTVPSTKNNMSNETKMEVVRETLPGIQEDVVIGLQHMLSQLTQSNLTSINIQLIIPYTSQYTPLPFHSSHERNTDISESNHDSYIGEESRNRIEVISPPNSSQIFQNSVPKIFDNVKKSIDAKMNNSIDVRKLQKNIDNWTIQEYSKATTVRTISPNSSQTISTVSPKTSNPYLFPSKKIPTEYFMTTKPVTYVADSHNDNSNILTLSGFSFSDEDNKGSGSNPVEKSRVIQIEKSTGSSIDASTASEDLWQGFPVGISSVNRERVYIVTPQPTVTTPRLNLEYRQEKALKEAERNRKELKKTLQTDTKITQKTDTFESIEKAYQVLPQAVNNLAVASTGPESVPLWGIMEHEEFASPVYSEYDNNDTEPPMPHSRFSKACMIIELIPLQEDHTLLVAAKRENSRRKIVGKDVQGLLLLFVLKTPIVSVED